MILTRYEGHNDFVGPEKRDGNLVSQYTDIYQGGWNWEAAEGLHANGGLMITYLNFNAIADTSASFNEVYCLRTPSGELISSLSFPQLKATDPKSIEFRQYLVDWLTNELAKGDGLDGVFADNGFSPVFPDDYQFDGRGVDRDTLVLYTDEDYMKDSVDLLNYIQSQFPQALIIANGFWSGHRYYQQYDAYQYAFENLNIVGLFSEGMFTNINGIVWPEDQWEQSIQFIKEVQTKWLTDKPTMFVTWSQSKATAIRYSIPEEQASAFIITSALMGTDIGGNAVSAHNGMRHQSVQDLYEIELGEPVDEMVQVPLTSLRLREYEKAVVIVNPSTTDGYVHEGNTYPALSGAIILKTNGGEPLSWTYTNQDDEVAIYKFRKVVVTEREVQVQPGETVTMTIAPDEEMVRIE